LLQSSRLWQLRHPLDEICQDYYQLLSSVVTFCSYYGEIIGFPSAFKVWQRSCYAGGWGKKPAHVYIYKQPLSYTDKNLRTCHQNKI